MQNKILRNFFIELMVNLSTKNDLLHIKVFKSLGHFEVDSSKDLLVLTF